MRYHLVLFESLILSDLEDLWCVVNLSDDELDSWKRNLLQETKRIQLALQATICDLTDKSQIEIYVQHHQAVLIRLIDIVNRVLNNDPADQFNSPRALQICQFVQTQMMVVIAFITSTYEKYLDRSYPVPIPYQISAVQDLERRVLTIKNESFASPHDNKLLDIFFCVINRYITSDPAIRLSFHQLHYFDKIIRIFERSIDRLAAEQEDGLKYWLFQVDFNDEIILDYFIKRLRCRLDGTELIPGQIELLTFELKWANQIQVIPGMGLHIGISPLKNRYCEWITEEIFFLERKRQLNNTLPLALPDDANTDFRLKTTFSVSQLAYFIKILVETGIIKNKNQTEVINFFSKSFGTPYAETISAGSLRSKFYYVEESACLAVKDTLINLLNYVRQSSNSNV